MCKHDTKKWSYLQVQHWYVLLADFNKLGNNIYNAQNKTNKQNPNTLKKTF